MTATPTLDLEPAGPPPAGFGLDGKRRRVADGAFRLAALASGLSVLAILLLIAVSTSQKALPALRQEGIGYVTGSRWAPNIDVFGALAFVSGTMIVSAIALALAVPVSFGIALFLSEFAPRRLRHITIYVIDMLAAVPSVVFGLWGLIVLAPWIVKIYDWIADKVDPVPVLNILFGKPVNGRSFFTAGIILALMITPIITSLTREVFDTVPPGQKEAAWALGATRWEMVRGAILPHSRTGMIGAVMLGLGRAMGETIAAALVIGSSARLTLHLFSSGDAMAAVIANQFGESGGLHRSALVAMGVVLFAMTIVVNMVARAIAGKTPSAAPVRGRR
ncbi:MAG: phosphate transport system permease protein [Actinomycetota bacterium]|nr:phosphate transport system permease protein [Actinomycetota bacterium]